MPRTLHLEEIELTHRSMSRNERILHHDVVAAGGPQSHDVPVFDDAIVGAGQEKVASLRLCPCCSRWYDGAEQDPRTVRRAAGESPAAAEAIATGHHRDFSDRHVG